MAITKKDIEHAALLARLELSENEKDIYTSQMGSILKYVENISRVNTQGIEPTTHSVPMKKVLRDDVATSSISNDDALMNAPEKDRGCFKVPRIIE
ncbi:MAG: Asp-tRNA(Asn)/Glu-tRNA(Gln) amidotransferase subunit GatC [Deltaproteobacteria bacterium]|nr:Asp-tRNA(Asn)/Glu-tRNA(Gln) amidotransferase subunit GatC [Deltaproteobacteria bacterium]